MGGLTTDMDIPKEAFDDATEQRIAALEEKLASYDVRLTILERLEQQADTDEFVYFWDKYPRKVGKGQARKAFPKALKKVSFDNLMDGLARYKKNKPDKIDWKHPATWLNSEGWEDDWTGERSEAPTEPEASTEGQNTILAVKALEGLYNPSQLGFDVNAWAIRAAFCAKRDRDLHILAACSDSVPEIKRFMPAQSEKTDHDVLRIQATIRTQLDAISMDLGYGPIQWPRAS